MLMDLTVTPDSLPSAVNKAGKEGKILLMTWGQPPEGFLRIAFYGDAWERLVKMVEEAKEKK